MITIRKSQDRGYANHGWLQSYHSFSFANYYDRAHMGFGNLRVINEDWIDPGTGFGAHGHRDMEIITYVLAGELAHEDSMGHIRTISPGEVQRMSAGSGVVHSEFNHAAGQPTHLLQIWITPHTRGITPSYEQKRFETERKQGRLCLLASPDGAQDSVQIHADAWLYAGLLNGNDEVTLALNPARKAYVFLARGTLQVNGQSLGTGDAALLSAESQLQLNQAQAAEVLVFDLAA